MCVCVCSDITHVTCLHTHILDMSLLHRDIKSSHMHHQILKVKMRFLAVVEATENECTQLVSVCMCVSVFSRRYCVDLVCVTDIESTALRH